MENSVNNEITFISGKYSEETHTVPTKNHNI